MTISSSISKLIMKPRKFATPSSNANGNASGNSCQSVKSTASDESSIAISSIPSHSCIHRRRSSAPLSVSWEDVSDHSLSTCDESTDSGEASVLHTVEEGASSPQRPQHEQDDDDEEDDDDATYSTLYQDLQDIQSSRQYPRRGSLLELILAEDTPTIYSGCTESTQKMRRPQGGRRRGSSSCNSSSVIQDRILMDDESSILDLMELRYGASSNSTAVDDDNR